MQPDHSPSLEGPTQPHVDLTDPLEVARWSWLLDVPDHQIHHAVRLVGNNGDAVAHYIELYGRPAGRARH
ncbi:DUF3606 domain-containing protein [Piscinibacter gummiphilus]|uniref:DUF3606 domain-containing protein n=1 Tax=Piscinibacter gummiphilus TaxID=946333 RepID=A0ABZ0CSH8_9BURK|nr:DUF3606 domain-containing protein [Piscinibacter gummiphilus]WOB07939.1 DUF3606 domain-containing protein [Piscinibacter gummiphilus]